MDKQNKKEKPKPREFLIEISAMAPVTLKYRVIAENAEKALEEVKLNKVSLLEPPKLNLNKIKKNRFKVIDWLTSKLILIK